MSICGYNQEIGSGLTMLLKGITSSIEEKAAKAGTIQAIDHELYELGEMITAMKDKGPIQEIFVGLNVFAQKIFTEVKVKLQENPQRTITNIMEELGPTFVNTIKDAEEFRESLDESALLKENKMPIHVLAEWINQSTLVK